MVHSFFDTSALKHRYITSPYSAKINRIIGNRRVKSYIAEVTILEMPSALGGFCRKERKSVAQYDLMDLRFLQDIAERRFTVRATHNKLDVLRARNLLRFGGMIRLRSMGSADALIATCTLDLAHELKQRIRFYTADWTLYSTLLQVDAYTAAMDIQYLLPPRVPTGVSPAAPAHR